MWYYETNDGDRTPASLLEDKDDLQHGAKYVFFYTLDLIGRPTPRYAARTLTPRFYIVAGEMGGLLVWVDKLPMDHLPDTNS
jgi:hypothetical protein